MGQCLCVGGAEPYLAMDHWKLSKYMLKMLKLLWKFGISDTSKGLEKVAVKKAGPWGVGIAAHTCCGCCPCCSSCWGPGGFAKHPWIHWETSRSMPPVTRCLVLVGFLFVCFGCFYYFFPCYVKEETERRPPSQTGSHKHFRTNPGNSGWRKALVWPQSWKHQRKSNASSSAGGPSWRALVHTSHGTHSHRCSLPKEIRILSFIIFFWLKWHYINFHLSFSIVSSYTAQFRNLSETDLISNLISTDHIPVYVVTHFYFPGLTQDHFSDAHCMPSGLAETVQLWCLSQFYKLGSFGILNLKWSFGSFSIFIFVNARGIKWTLIFKDC